MTITQDNFAYAFDYVGFAKRLRVARHALEFTEEQMAGAMGISTKMLHKYKQRGGGDAPCL